MPLTPFKSLIKDRCGLSFDDSREVILVEGIRARLAERDVPSQRDYLKILSDDPEEFNSLVNLITVKETYFFREPLHFTVLTETIIPEMLAKTGGRRIRIVCAGCSTGEEPYSVAIALAARFGREFTSMFSIVGTDIDEEALGNARRGVYAEHSFRGVPPHIQRTYFSRHAKGYSIRNPVRNGVVFIRLNLFGDSYPEMVRDADIIFYRNVSIYFEDDTRQHIFRKLAGLLNDQGCLFLGSAETFIHNTGILSLVEKGGVFMYEKVGMKVPEPRRSHGLKTKSAIHPGNKTLHRRQAAPAAPDPISETDEVQRLFGKALESAGNKKYADALLLAGRAASLQPSFTKAHMLQAGILLNLQRLDEAEKVCGRSLKIDPLLLEGHLLLGLIAKCRGNYEESKKKLRDALYIRSSCWLAHFYLGDIYRVEGERLAACREYEIVIKLLEENRYCEHGLTLFVMSFPLEQVVHLCRHNLSEMKRRRHGQGGRSGI